MSQIGIGVLIAAMRGNSFDFSSVIGKKIKDLRLDVDGLIIEFADTAIMIFDDGQSCCEDRYMTTDDDLKYYIGSTLMGAVIADAPNRPAEYGEHEVQFLIVNTSLGDFTVETHNEHNGYYGGFLVRVKEIGELKY